MSEEAARLVQILQGAIETGVGIAEARAALVIHISRIERERDEAQEWDRRSKAALLDAGRRIAALEAENAALRADAERYRWLRDGNAYFPEEQMIEGGSYLDEAIDAARAAEQPAKSSAENVEAGL